VRVDLISPTKLSTSPRAESRAAASPSARGSRVPVTAGRMVRADTFRDDAMEVRELMRVGATDVVTSEETDEAD